MGSVLLIFLVFCVVLSYVYVLSFVLWCSLWFPHTNYMFGSSLHPVVCGRVHVLFTFIIYLLSIYAVKWLVVGCWLPKVQRQIFQYSENCSKSKKKKNIKKYKALFILTGTWPVEKDKTTVNCLHVTITFKDLPIESFIFPFSWESGVFLDCELTRSPLHHEHYFN